MSAFKFNISLSVLNHLGRNLYRSFMTILGEAISNSWDADAKNVYIDIDRDAGQLVIRDDGHGMSEDDFQNKFLRIGYSKRKNNISKTESGRPFIGRKGIGKLALLSCAKKVTVISKKKETELIGGIIDNAGLDEAIKDDVSANEYALPLPEPSVYEKFGKNMESGTVLFFEDVNDGIRHRIDYIRKLLALYFRFSLFDPSFNIILDGSPISLNDLDDLVEKTQFLWMINDSDDPYISEKLQKTGNLREEKRLEIDDATVFGFIASVEKPSMLKIRETDEKVSVDLYVNGRLREKDILRHIPTARIVESYLYGQIHYNSLDDENDRFTSSREGIVSNDPKFKFFLEKIEEILRDIINDWDVWRVKIKQDGDPENDRITRKERKSAELFNIVVNEFMPPKSNTTSRGRVEEWVDGLSKDATFNFCSYGECFVAENLLRKYIMEKGISISNGLSSKIRVLKEKADRNKGKANISFEIREDQTELSYCAMDDLVYLINDTKDQAKASLARDAAEYKPIRDAMSHTSRLTSAAKNKLNATYENIKARIIELLGNV